jgi:hypothetical protein
VSEGLKNEPALAKLAASKKRMTAKSLDFRIVFPPALSPKKRLVFKFDVHPTSRRDNAVPPQPFLNNRQV